MHAGLLVHRQPPLASACTLGWSSYCIFAARWSCDWGSTLWLCLPALRMKVGCTRGWSVWSRWAANGGYLLYCTVHRGCTDCMSPWFLICFTVLTVSSIPAGPNRWCCIPRAELARSAGDWHTNARSLSTQIPPPVIGHQDTRKGDRCLVLHEETARFMDLFAKRVAT